MQYIFGNSIFSWLFFTNLWFGLLSFVVTVLVFFGLSNLLHYEKNSRWKALELAALFPVMAGLNLIAGFSFFGDVCIVGIGILLAKLVYDIDYQKAISLIVFATVILLLFGFVSAPWAFGTGITIP